MCRWRVGKDKWSADANSWLDALTVDRRVELRSSFPVVLHPASLRNRSCKAGTDNEIMEIFRVDKYVTLGEVEVGGGAAGRPFHLELAGRPPVRTTLPLATFAPSSPHSLTHTKLTGSGMSAFGAKTSDLCPQAGGFERSGRMERTVSTRSSSHGPGSPLRRTRCPTPPDSERHSKEGRQGR